MPKPGLITFSSSVPLERVANDWGLILHDFSTLFTQLIVENLDKSILLKNGFIIFSKDVILQRANFIY